MPGGTLSELSFTSLAFSPKIAVSSFSSGLSSVSPFGRDLADQDVARLDVGADPDDAALVEVHHALVGDVGDFPGDLLLAPLGVADVQLELLDVDRRVDVVLHQPLAQDDGVLEVVPVPRHERHQHVAAERQLAALGGRAVGDDLAGLDPLVELHQGPLVDGGVLVGAPELLDPVAVVLVQPRQRRVAHLGAVGAGVDDDLVGRDPRDRARSGAR